MGDNIVPYKKPAGEDFAEPELVDDGQAWRGAQAAPEPGGREQDGGPVGAPPAGPLYAIFARLKAVFITAVLLLSFGLIALGALLTSTLIGAVIGIPLILLGSAPLWLLFRFLLSGRKTGVFIFRSFRR